jgi:hypothetical protein
LAFFTPLLGVDVFVGLALGVLAPVPNARRRSGVAPLRVAAVLIAFALLGCAPPTERVPVPKCPPPVTLGLDADGRPTPVWLDAIRDRVDAAELASIARTPKPLSPEESAWRDLIAQGATSWCADIPRLDAPFRHVTPPAHPGILLGNQGGGDGFTHDPDDVAIDLHEMAIAYTGIPADQRHALIRRLLAHEYTHLLLHRWMDANGWSEGSVASDPFRQALRTLYNEGIANYRSIEDPRWIAASGDLTPHARETLAALQPIMMERLQHLATRPTPDQAGPLLRNISQGPLERKWGAIPIALWLAEETHGDPARMATRVEANPDGILGLGVRYGEPQYRGAFSALLAQARARAASR